MSDLPTIPGPRGRFPGHLALTFLADPMGFLVRTAARYGDVSTFRIRGVRYFLVNDPETTRDVLVTRAASFAKSSALRQAQVTLGQGLLTSEGEFHRRQRRLSQPAFHPQRVATYARAMVRRARQTSAEWRDGAVVDLHEEMMRLTLRVVTETLFGADVDAEIDEIGRAMDVLVRMFRRARNPFAPVLNRLPLPSNYRFLKALAQVRRTVDWFVVQRRMSGEDRGDLLSTLLRARDSADGGDAAVAADVKSDAAAGMTDEQLRDEIVTLFTAGHETTANALTFTWRLVAHHPAVAERLYAEVDAVLVGREGDSEIGPTAADLDRLPYARAVVAESMRLFPPAWVLMREATADAQVGPAGLVVPAGSVVVMSQWIAHRDPRWWPDPERFDPDRWLDPAARDARPKYAYFPFGGGPRNCIGEAFAWAEAVLLLVTLAKDWRMTDVSSRPMRLLPTITLRPRDPVPVKLSRRARSST